MDLRELQSTGLLERLSEIIGSSLELSLSKAGSSVLEDRSAIGRLLEELEEVRRRARRLEALVIQLEGKSKLLLESDRELRSLRDSSPDPMVAYDTRGHTLYVNPAFVDTFGWSLEELAGHQIDYVPDECRSQTKETLSRLFEGEQVPSFETKRLTKDGRTLDIHISSAMFTDNDGNPAGHVVTLRDITQRKQTEEALRESEQRLRLALERKDSTFQNWDTDGNGLERDRDWAAMPGYGSNRTGSWDPYWEKRVHPEDWAVVTEALRDYIERRSPRYAVDYRMLMKTGQWKLVRDHDQPVESDAQGNLRSPSSARNGNTAREQADHTVRALTQSLFRVLERERKRISLDLHDQVAQDLSALRMAVETLPRSVPETDPATQQTMREISLGLRKLVTTVRNLSYELSPPGLEKFGLVSTIDQHCREFSEKNDVSVEFLGSKDDSVTLDVHTEINLFRVVQEALNNVLRHADANRVELELTASLSTVTLLIEDNGRGFDVKKEFARALTDRRMGLWSIEQRVSMLGGEVTIRSRPGHGTRIHVEVPSRGTSR